MSSTASGDFLSFAFPAALPPRYRVLIADANPDFCLSLSHLLELSGMAVVSACDGHRAMALFDSFAPHAVITELRLPGLDGFELCTRIRALRGRAPLIIAQTGWLTPPTTQRASAVGFDHSMLKPGDPMKLIGILRRPGHR